MTAPCKDCIERKIGCHSDCKRYINYIEYKHYIKRKQDADNDTLRLTPSNARNKRYNSLKTLGRAE